MNRRWVYLIVSFVLLGIWLFVGSTRGLLGAPLPGLGEFFNPARGFWQNATEGQRLEKLALSIEDTRARGDIYFDERGVPHIFADNLESACYLQGYVHAYDRLWQMDISTRATEGRLSEVLGERTLERDRSQVKQGYREAARRITREMQERFPEDYRYLQAYAAGVNDYAATLTPEVLPVEYKILDHEPLEWSPYRSVLFTLEMATGLCGSHDDIEATTTLSDFGPEVVAKYFPERFPEPSPVVPSPPTRLIPREPQPPSANRIGEAGRGKEGILRTRPPEGIGSNNWAMAPGKSNTGYPLLANDPHLSLTFPSIWYESQITFPGCNARGVGLPGAPGLPMGFNDFVAWGETNVQHDVTDFYRINWTDTTRNAYFLDGVERQTEWVYDTVYLSGEIAEVVRLPWTYFGPVPDRDGPYADLATRWLAFAAPAGEEADHGIIGTFLRLMQAENYTDYLDALNGYVAPPQNFLFASRGGDVVIRPNGAFPIRSVGNGRYVLEGDSTSKDWRGSVPFRERPEHRNPPRGFVSSANQVSTGPGYPYDYRGFFDEYRGRYINRWLGRQPVMNQRRMKELQLDDYSLLAEELTPLLIARLDRSALTDDGRELLRTLSEWDYRYGGNQRAPVLFERWRRELYRLTFDEFPRDSNYLRPETWRLVDLLRRSPSDDIFDIQDTGNFRETAATLVQRVFDELLEEYGADLPPTWAEYRDARIPHLGRIPGFGSPLITTGGGRQTPRVVDDGFGGSWRMVIELGEEPRGWGALPGGASGNPGSRFYDNNFPDWAEGQYYELSRWADPDEAAREAIGHWSFSYRTN